jgi:putative transcriptional regulator
VVVLYGSFPRARPILAKGKFMVTRARLKNDGTVVEILRDGTERPLAAQIDRARIDATTEEEIARQIAEDDAEAMRDAAAYARRVRRKVGLSQVAFARRIGVPVDTVRNWEQGRRAPQGPARALLRIIDRAPETALQALAEV